MWTVQYRCQYREHWYDYADPNGVEMPQPDWMSAYRLAVWVRAQLVREVRIVGPDGTLYGVA